MLHPDRIRAALHATLDAFPNTATNQPFLLRHWHSEGSRYAACERAAKFAAGATIAATERTERLRAIFDFANLVTDPELTSQLQTAALSDDRFNFGIRSIADVDENVIRPTIVAFYASLFLSGDADSASHAIEIATEFASQDVLEFFSVTGAETSGDEKLPASAAYVKNLVFDLIAVGLCGLRGPKKGIPETLNRQVDAVVRVQLALAYLWQITSSYARQHHIVASASEVVGRDLSKGPPRPPPTIDERLQKQVLLRGPYCVTGHTRVHIPDMLPPHVQQTGIRLCRKTGIRIERDKEVAARVLRSSDKLTQAQATRHALRQKFEAMRRAGEPTRGELVKVAVPAGEASPTRQSTRTPSPVEVAKEHDAASTQQRSQSALSSYNTEVDAVQAVLIDDDKRGVESIIQHRTARATSPVLATDKAPAASSTIRPAPIFVSQQRQRRVEPREVFTIHHCSELRDKPPREAFNNFLSPTMARFNRFQFDAEKIKYQLEPEQKRQQQLEERRAKAAAAQARAMREFYLQI